VGIDRILLSRPTPVTRSPRIQAVALEKRHMIYAYPAFHRAVEDALKALR